MQKIPLNQNWFFHGDDSTNSSIKWLDSDPTSWRKVDLPHDWSIELERSPENPSVASGGYFEMGSGWYQKKINIPQEWQQKKIFIEFEGVYMNSEVWINGHFLGRHPYGYTAFHYDLTPYLKFGSAENQLYVAVHNNLQLNSRWYSGSGIYRPVWLLVENPVHFAIWGVSVTTPEVSSKSATVSILLSVVNQSDSLQSIQARTRILSSDGKTVAEQEQVGAIEPTNRTEFTMDYTVQDPELWSPEKPTLYHLHSELMVNGQLVDIEVTSFGIRSFEFSAENGFVLNGKSYFMKGGCVHHDNGILGAASYSRSEERKVELLKASGFNAIRCAHNPPSSAFLDACDKLGMLVIDEAFDCWREGKTVGDYHCVFDDWWQRDLESMVYRDRNHPSVIVWSIGNELVERLKPEGAVIARTLANHIRSIDPTRPVTAAINGGSSEDESWSNADEIFSALDVCGYNYQQSENAPDHTRHPERVLFATESFPMQAFENWMDVLEMPHVVGDFVWTSLDYLGEAGIGRISFEEDEFAFLGKYPWNQANCGDIDLCGFKRPQSYYRDILWGNGDKLYIAVHTPIPEGKTPSITRWGWHDVWSNWNWFGKENQIFTVDVYSACNQVELFLNGKSLGVKPATRNTRFIASYDVPYQPGELKAIGYMDGKPDAEMTLNTVNTPVAIRLKPDRPTIKSNYGDLCFVSVEVIDTEGRLHPLAEQDVYFTVQGPGVIAAVGNSDPKNMERYVGNKSKAYRGRCLVAVKTIGQSGIIKLRAQADGLSPAEIIIHAL